MKQLSINEIHGVLLETAKTFTEVCERHNIPYYMLGGTMLGAIRHKGFIPWDDDMDFGVPRPYYSDLIYYLQRELKPPYKCSTFFNSSNIVYPYAKIENTLTRLDTAQLKGNVIDKIGVNIDVFPLDYCFRDDSNVKKVIRLADIYGRIYTESSGKSVFLNIVKRIIRIIIPFSQSFFYNLLEKKISRIKKGDCLANLFGHWEEKEIIPCEWYGEGSLYDFESIRLRGFQEYSKYLENMYGDYNSLPPVEKRMPHGDKAYSVE